MTGVQTCALPISLGWVTPYTNSASHEEIEQIAEWMNVSRGLHCLAYLLAAAGGIGLILHLRIGESEAG